LKCSVHQGPNKHTVHVHVNYRKPHDMGRGWGPQTKYILFYYHITTNPPTQQKMHPCSSVHATNALCNKHEQMKPHPLPATPHHKLLLSLPNTSTKY